MWIHESCPIIFTVGVIDFNVEYVDRSDTEYLEAALQVHYPMTQIGQERNISIQPLTGTNPKEIQDHQYPDTYRKH